MKLRYYQQDAIDSFFRFYDEGGEGNSIIAMPTGTGKSVVIAHLIKKIMSMYDGQRILMLTHVKELISQNYKALLSVWATAPAGIYSAGLNRKDAGFPITYAGIGSIHKKAVIFQKTTVVVIDEVHMVPSKGGTMYEKFISDLKKYNPDVLVIGLSATPFRTGLGMLTNGWIFSAFCYDITGIAPFNRLVREGYLAPLIPVRPDTQLDVSGIKITNGDYSIAEMEERYGKDEILIKCLDDAVKRGADRKHWLVFVAGVKSCYKVAELLNERYGISTRVIHGPSKDFPFSNSERDENIAAFKAGKIQALVNNNVLTTGFDYSGIDFLLILRPTTSAPLWVQILGRGTRPVWPERDGSNWNLWPSDAVASGRYDTQTDEGRLLCIKEGPKQNCLVADYAANTKSLGPINDPVIPRPPGKKGPPRIAPVRICDNCGTYNHVSARVCIQCDFEFPRIVKLKSQAANEDLIREEKPFQIEIFKVKRVIYDVHSKTGKPDSLRVSYTCGLREFDAWQCFEHPQPMRHHARDWWRTAAANGEDAPETTAEALVRTGELRMPTHLRVRLDTKYPQIMDYDYSNTAFGSES